ncbi:MAG: hypothetical protein HRU05_17440 [Oceanospirillaceae bacterium]|nr:hypothetical protein [Oceanospirillaceae bacterium]
MHTANAKTQQRQFYLFVCSHSFLIGLFPFFLPVYLYKQGLNMTQISFFIAISATTFTLAIYVWDLIKASLTPQKLLALCYFLELLMVATVILVGPHITQQPALAYLIAASYGCYQCFFWTTQRALFIQRNTDSDTGNRYGNFQIFVVLALKIGVFIGALLLNDAYLYLLMIVSIITISISYLFLLKIPGELSWPFLAWPVTRISQVIRFKDNYRSKEIFALDGFFLFIESFFWLLSLFLILKQSFIQLGLMIIAITLTLSVVFLLLKNTIDKLPEQLIYVIAVIGYGLSWIFRAQLDEQLALHYQFIYLCLIAFLTALFRLAFNKRFYDLALHYPKTPYILMKSYYSQMALVVCFTLLGWVFIGQQTLTSLNLGYWIAAGLTPLYFLYKTRVKRPSPKP